MRKLILLFFAFALIGLTACESEICVKCTQINGTDVQNFCSKEVHERNDFMVEWIHKNYYCEQVEESK